MAQIRLAAGRGEPAKLGALALAIWVLAAAPAFGVCPRGLPPGVYCGFKAPPAAGAYALDPNHAAVIARVQHLGYSYSIFRFDKVEGTLAWDPANLAKSSLTASVETASIATNVAGFPKQISDNYLKAGAFPRASFVSKRFRHIDATHGMVDGDFTLMGKTRPLTFAVELVGAGKGFGAPRLGIEARSHIDAADFGLPPMFTAPIELVIDAEFAQKKS